MSLIQSAFRSLVKDKNVGEDAIIESITEGISDVTIRCVFYSTDEKSKINQVSVNASRPELECLSSDIIGVDYGRKITVRGTAFHVKEIHPDGFGLTVLLLTTD